MHRIEKLQQSKREKSMKNYPLLSTIKELKDFKKLNETDYPQLIKEIRKIIIEVVSKNGGHLASNLGVVELTIALHAVFDSPKDKIKESGLWLVNELYKEPLSENDISFIQSLIIR